MEIENIDSEFRKKVINNKVLDFFYVYGPDYYSK